MYADAGYTTRYGEASAVGYCEVINDLSDSVPTHFSVIALASECHKANIGVTLIDLVRSVCDVSLVRVALLSWWNLDVRCLPCNLECASSSGRLCDV